MLIVNFATPKGFEAPSITLNRLDQSDWTNQIEMLPSTGVLIRPLDLIVVSSSCISFWIDQFKNTSI